jgi:UDP-glucose 4-epimerase
VRGGSLVVHSQGTQTRDYVFVDDVVRCMVAAATAPGLDNAIINVGSGTETSVRELVRLVVEMTGSTAEVVYNPRTSPGVSRMCADLSLAHEKLGYQPHVSLSEGLRLTLERDPRFRREVPTRPLNKI